MKSRGNHWIEQNTTTPSAALLEFGYDRADAINIKFVTGQLAAAKYIAWYNKNRLPQRKNFTTVQVSNINKLKVCTIEQKYLGKYGRKSKPGDLDSDMEGKLPNQKNLKLNHLCSKMGPSLIMKDAKDVHLHQRNASTGHPNQGNAEHLNKKIETKRKRKQKTCPLKVL